MSEAFSRKPLKIFFMTSASVLSGGDKHLIDLIKRLDLSAVEPTILCTGTDPFSRVLNERLGLGIRIKTGFSRRSFLRVLAEFRKNKPDAIVFVTGTINAFPWYQFVAARIAGARTCAIYHMFSPILEPVTRNGHWLRYLTRRTFGYRARYLLGAKIVGLLTHRSICVSANLRELLVGWFGFPPERTVTIHNGVDFRHYGIPDAQARSLRRELGIGSADIVVMSACRLVPLKGLDVLLRAIHSLRDKVPNLKCVVLGEGPSKEDLLRACADMNLDSRVFLVGFKENVRACLQAADIFVNPSLIECFPLAVLEAMACGLPCIGARAGGVPEIISDQQDGLLVTPGSVDQLGAAIERLALNTFERKRMSERAKEKIRLHFDIEESMERIKSVLLQSNGTQCVVGANGTATSSPRRDECSFPIVKS